MSILRKKVWHVYEVPRIFVTANEINCVVNRRIFDLRDSFVGDWLVTTEFSRKLVFHSTRNVLGFFMKQLGILKKSEHYIFAAIDHRTYERGYRRCIAPGPAGYWGPGG